MLGKHDEAIFQLEDYKDTVLIPDGLDEAIRAGVLKGQREKQKRTIWAKRWRFTVTAACLFLVAFVGSIRYSPAFAAFVREIPGLEGFVKLIQKSYHNSVYMAVDHDLIQPIGQSDTHDGITFTVEGILADESRMILFYSVTGERNGNFYYAQPTLLDVQGQPMDAFIVTDHSSEKELWEDDPYGPQQGTFDIILGAGRTLPNEVRFQVQMSEIGYEHIQENSPVYEVFIAIDHQFFADMKEEYVVGKTIEVEGQRIYIDKVVHHPLTTEVHLEYDESNTMHIFSPIDMLLVDENGEIYTLSHEVYSESNHKVLYFMSNYFHKSSQLWLVGETFKALDKENMVVVVDTENKKIIEAPDEKVLLTDIAPTEHDIRLTFLLRDIDPADPKRYSLFSPFFEDASGNVHFEAYQEGKRRTKTTTISEGVQEVYYYIENEEYAQPLTLTITDYPNYIREPYRIQIK